MNVMSHLHLGKGLGGGDRVDFTGGQQATMSERTKFQDRRLGVICCGHVFRRERPVQLVDRHGKYWQFLCGGIDHADRKDAYHVSVGALLDFDPSLNEVADLPAQWEAERNGPASPWIRTRSCATDA